MIKQNSQYADIFALHCVTVLTHKDYVNRRQTLDDVL